MEQHVEITEELAERLTPRKDDGVADCMDRIKLLECLADVCMQQGQYHLATKKFTQAGSKLKVIIETSDFFVFMCPGIHFPYYLFRIFLGLTACDVNGCYYSGILEKCENYLKFGGVLCTNIENIGDVIF